MREGIWGKTHDLENWSVHAESARRSIFAEVSAGESGLIQVRRRLNMAR